MPRMIDLIRASAVPANLVQSAARGGLALPPQEMLEILVYLATESKPFGEQARLTLAGWDEASCRAVAANPETPEAVLSYFSDRENFRPTLFEALLANPSVDEECLAALAALLSREVVDTALDNERVIYSKNLLLAMASNPNLNEIQMASIEERIASFAQMYTALDTSSKSDLQVEAVTDADIPSIPDLQVEAVIETSSSDGCEIPQPSQAPQLVEADDEAEEIAIKYIAEHATEIAADGEKPFQPIGGIHEDEATAETKQSLAKAAAVGSGSEAAATTTTNKHAPQPSMPQRGSALQRISQLDIKGRIQLAMKGSKEERALLVRDGTKIVALAVLDSPKISDSEVEKFASQKNVLEAVLRTIPLKRRFMKQYNIVRNLVFNPRTPIDVSLGLMKNILVADLKNLSGNKEVSDTVRKLALRMYRQKLVVDR